MPHPCAGCPDWAGGPEVVVVTFGPDPFLSTPGYDAYTAGKDFGAHVVSILGMELALGRVTPTPAGFFAIWEGQAARQYFDDGSGDYVDWDVSLRLLQDCSLAYQVVATEVISSSPLTVNSGTLEWVEGTLAPCLSATTLHARKTRGGVTYNVATIELG